MDGPPQPGNDGIYADYAPDPSYGSAFAESAFTTKPDHAKADNAKADNGEQEAPPDIDTDAEAA